MSIRKRIIKPKKLVKHLLPSDEKVIPKNLPAQHAHCLETVYAPYSQYAVKLSRFPKELWNVPRTDIIIGMCLCRHGIDASESSTAWLCTTPSHVIVNRDVSQGFRKTKETIKGLRPIFIYVGTFKPGKGRTWADAREAAHEAIIEAYEDHHNVNLFAE